VRIISSTFISFKNCAKFDGFGEVSNVGTIEVFSGEI